MWIVANHDQERVGWTWVGPALGVSGDSYIYEIEVDPAFRGSGLGGSALDQIETLVREAGAARLGLHIFETNVAARHLYEGKGFVVTHREPGHVEMWKDLAGVDSS
jgi:ribosomal protein S18 acetylase RimI-like enzyme